MSDVTTQEAGNTQATGTAQTAEVATAATVAAPAAAPAAAAPAQSQQATDVQAAATTAQPSAAPPAAPAQPAGAPEKYEFKSPQGVSLDDAAVAEFSAVAKELNLPQDAAQKVIDKLAPKLAESNLKTIYSAMEKQTATWRDAVKADAEIGGEKLNENLAVARKAVERFASPTLRALFDPFHPKDNPTGTGLGNHPDVVRLFHSIGKAISEDRFVGGSAAPSKGARDAAEGLYPTKA